MNIFICVQSSRAEIPVDLRIESLGTQVIYNNKIKMTKPTTFEEYKTWWNDLEEQWQKAFNQAILNKQPITNMPTQKEMEDIWMAQALRFAGTTAMFPNMSFDLTNVSGLVGFDKVEILVLINQKLTSVKQLKGLKQLKSLFLYHNEITSLDGIKKLRNLEEIYFNVNKISSLKPLSKLTKLHTIYCNHNNITSFEGITLKHEDNLRQFVGLPNEGIRQREVMKFEREIGVKVKQG